MHLRLQDFKSVSDYNSTLFKISSQLKLCGVKVTEEDIAVVGPHSRHEKSYMFFQAYLLQ